MEGDNPSWGYARIHEVWTAHGLVTHHTLVVIDIATRPLLG
jgi:hypothetical protein